MNAKCFECIHNFFSPFFKQGFVFKCLQYKTFENTVGKGEIARYEQFLLFPQRFLPFWRTFCHFSQIQNCRLQTLSVWRSLKLAFRKELTLSYKTVTFNDPEELESCLGTTYEAHVTLTLDLRK